MKSEHIWKIIGAVVTLGGGLIGVYAAKPFNAALLIFGAALAFFGRLLAEYGDDWF